MYSRQPFYRAWASVEKEVKSSTMHKILEQISRYRNAMAAEFNTLHNTLIGFSKVHGLTTKVENTLKII